MSYSLNTPFRLIGLPGCGVSTLTALIQQTPLCVFNELEGSVFTVINMAEALPCEFGNDYLIRCLEVSNGVVFSFVELADLDRQMAWQAWLKKRISQQALLNLSRFRMLNRQLPTSLLKDSESTLLDVTSLLKPALKPFNQLSLPKAEELRFSVQRIHIDNLWQCLDALRQQPSMHLLRLKGQVMTYQYPEPVAIEVTLSDMKAYPVKSAQSHSVSAGEKQAVPSLDSQLVIQGVNLDENWLSEMIFACQYP